MLLVQRISITTIIMNDISLIRLLQLVSPALPVGAFAFSQGLESAVENGLILNQGDTQKWVQGVLENNIATLDLPVLRYASAFLEDEDFHSIETLNAHVIAFRETREFRAESLKTGKALRRLLRDLHHSSSDLSTQAFLASMHFDEIDWVIAFAYAAKIGQVDKEAALLGYVWSWCENQIAAAIKLVPLGQTQGQRVLSVLGAHLPTVIEHSKTISIDQLGALSPYLAILSSQHESQYSRLFLS